MHKGIAVSPGVAVGSAYCIHEIFVDPEVGARAMVPLRRMLDFAAKLHVTVKGNA